MTPVLHRPEDRILLILQFWKGDMAQAMKLARFIADMQNGKSESADFLFLSRFDCPIDMDVVNYVSRKFNVFTYTSRRRGTGWPHGCNELWFSGMDWFESMLAHNKVPKYKAAFTFEADGVPLSPTWIQQMSVAWDEQAAKKPTFVFGAELMAPGRHINGNMLVSGNLAFLHWLVKKKGGVTSRGGWDYVLAADFRKWGAYNFPQLKSYWASATFSRESFENELDRGTLYVHGVKDDSLLDMARKKFLG